MRKLRLTVIFALLTLALTYAPGSSALLARAASANTQDIGFDELPQKIKQLLRSHRSRYVLWGIHIVDLESGQVIYTRNAGRNFVPASNTKLFTTATALAKLGPDFRFRTSVYATSHPSEDGIVDGDLVLVGRGDPNLLEHPRHGPTAWVIEHLADQIYWRGIRRINGRIIGDDSYFPSDAKGNSLELKDLWPNRRERIPVSALSINGNNIRLVVIPGANVGSPAAVLTEPSTNYIKIENQAKTVSYRSARTVRLIRRRGSNTVIVTGRLPAGRTYEAWIAVDDPAHFAATLLKEALERRGIEVDGQAQARHSDRHRLSPRQGWIEVAAYASLPLSKLIEVINKESQNFYAELLLRVLGAELRNEGSRAAGLEVERDFLRQIGIKPGEVMLDDGSGLSRNNQATPGAIVELLQYLYKQDYFDLFRNSLAVSGVDGTLKQRLNEPETRERIHAKTGTLADVLSLSGYMSTNAGKTLAFSIMANGLTSRQHRVKWLIDSICHLMVSYY